MVYFFEVPSDEINSGFTKYSVKSKIDTSKKTNTKELEYRWLGFSIIKNLHNESKDVVEEHSDDLVSTFSLLIQL